MATNIPPHNLGEVVDALIALIHNPNASVISSLRFLLSSFYRSDGYLCKSIITLTQYIEAVISVKLTGSTFGIACHHFSSDSDLSLSFIPFYILVMKAKLISY